MGCYTAHETRRYARHIRLAPLTTPVESPLSNGTAKPLSKLSNEITRVSSKPDAKSVLHQIPQWLDHYNRVHPDRSLGYRSPRELINRSTTEKPSGL